jgi:hypothetical protein
MSFNIASQALCDLCSTWIVEDVIAEVDEEKVRMTMRRYEAM